MALGASIFNCFCRSEKSYHHASASNSILMTAIFCFVVVIAKLHPQSFSGNSLLLLQPFNGLFSRTTWVSRYQKGKTNLDFTGARDSEWQWHQLGHMQVCTSLQTDNHASTPPLVFYRPDALPAAQPTASKH